MRRPRTGLIGSRAPRRVVVVSVLLATIAAGCGSKKWDARDLDRSESLTLDGISLTVHLPAALSESDVSERQAIFGVSEDDDAPDGDGVWPSVNVVVDADGGPLPNDPSHIAVPDDAVDVAELSDGHVRVRLDGQHTLVEEHFMALPGAEGYIRCRVVLYGGMNGVRADHQRRRAWIQRLCDGITVD